MKSLMAYALLNLGQSLNKLGVSLLSSEEKKIIANTIMQKLVDYIDGSR